ncbi:MAG: hypothetical protein ACXWXL_14565 [Candidatus Binatia bacterium]
MEFLFYVEGEPAAGVNNTDARVRVLTRPIIGMWDEDWRECTTERYSRYFSTACTRSSKRAS